MKEILNALLLIIEKEQEQKRKERDDAKIAYDKANTIKSIDHTVSEKELSVFLEASEKLDQLLGYLQGLNFVEDIINQIKNE